ncbi:CHASE2 domain-containing protein [Campylobacter lanienae]|uniref:CHASE2 domain-containing protein n=1 Tax=Campylobacter lanienae TaxID=75658 RepID=UPI0015D69D18|nr:CHASE2 domain-containing protein [Campylobacter lanienae]
MVSKYPNIVYYSATELGNIFEEFEDAIVLIGSNYAASGDIHKTPLGDARSGVFVIADMINTSYLTGGDGLKVANWIVLLIFYTSSVFVLTYIVLKITHKSSDDDKRFYKLVFMSSKEKVIYIVNIIFFASCSVIVWYYYGYWISWIVPIMVFMLIDYGIFLIFYSAVAICNKIKNIIFLKKEKK